MKHNNVIENDVDCGGAMSGRQRTVEARNVDFDNFDDLSTMNLNITEAATGCCWHSDDTNDDCHHDGLVGREWRQSSSFEFGASKPSVSDMMSTMTSSSAHSLLDIIEGGSSPITIESSQSIIISSQPDDECSVSTRQRSAITAANSNTLGRRRQCRGTIMTISVALLLMVSTNLLLVFAAASAADMEIPEGLLFASEIHPQSSHSSDSFIRGATQQPPLLKLHNEEEDDADELHHQRRLHPIHRIYRGDGARIRRTMEELENSLPYYQTGIRGDPTHELQYRNHPFDRLRRERERKMKSRRELKSGEQLHQSQEQSKQRGEELMDEGNDEEHIITEEDVVRNLEGDGTSSSTADGDGSSNASGGGGDSGGEDENPFRPIRIHLDTTAIDAERTESNGAQIDFVKDIILPRMRDFWASALSVVPVSGNVVISSAELQGRLYCGDSEFSKVPTSHISVGVENTDLILYVSGAPSARFCGPTTLAVAVACNFDQFDRPTAGAINFCLDQIDLKSDGTASESITQDNVDVAIHEAAHVLGMSSNSYRFFWDPDTGMERTPRPFYEQSVICVDGVERSTVLPAENTMKFFVATSGQRYASIVTPRVTTIARNQFDCQELQGGQLENQPTGEDSCTGDHWDERMFYPESLSGVISPTTNFLSPVTLALLEDSGWYMANYTKSNVSPWGHGVGCDFINSPCLVGGGNGRDGVIPSYAKGFFCNKASSRGCSPGNTHKMACTVIDYSLRGEYLPPVQFQYFNDVNVGGPREADYCPVYGSVYSGLKPAALDCSISSNEGAIDLIYSEKYGDNSMCFETTSGEGRCYSARCIYEDFNLQLQVDGKWYTCTEDFQQIEVSTFSGTFGTTVTCPRLSSVCPDMFCPVNCAGRGKCIFGQTSGSNITRPRCECFDESDKSVGCSDTFVLDGKYLRDGKGLTDNLKTNFFEPLIAVFVDHPDTWTTASWAWAAALFVVFLLMILCICSSFWPEKKKPKARVQTRYAV